MARYWLGPWVWDAAGPEGAWRAPAGALGQIDLRSVPHCSAAGGTPQGVGLFVTPDALNLGSDYRNLGTDPDAVLSGAHKSAWRALLALPGALAANTLRGALWETLAVQGDPTGLDRCCPLVPSGRRFEVWLGGARARAAAFDAGMVEAAPLRDLLQRQYREVRRWCLDGPRDPILYRKVLGYWVRKYGVGYRWFQPADLPDEPDLPPATTVTDDFDRADGALGTAAGGWSWSLVNGTVTILSNQATSGDIGAANEARADSDLSAADHYSQAVIAAGGATAATSTGVIARKDASATRTFYRSGRDNGSLLLAKRIGGTNTAIRTDTPTFSLPDTVRLSCSGSTVEHFLNGVSAGSSTDTSIAAGLRCGIQANFQADGTGLLDDFEAADLGGGGGGPAIPIVMHHRRLMGVS